MNLSKVVVEKFKRLDMVRVILEQSGKTIYWKRKEYQDAVNALGATFVALKEFLCVKNKISYNKSTNGCKDVDRISLFFAVKECK